MVAGSRKTILQNSVLIGGGLVIGNFSSLAFRLVIARSFGPGRFGVFSIGFMMVSITTTVAVFGLPAGVTKFVSEYRTKGDYDRILLTIGISLFSSLILGSIFTIILLIWGPTFAKVVFNSPTSAKFLQWFSLQIPANIILILAAAFALGHEKGGAQVIIREVLPKVIVLALTIVVIVLEGTIMDVGRGYVVAQWFAAIVGISVIFNISPNINQTAISVRKAGKIIKPLFSYSTPLWLTTFAGFFLGWIDTFFVAYYLNDVSVGIYQAAFLLGSSLNIFSIAISRSLFPNFAALLTNGKTSKVSNRYKGSIRWGALLSAAPFFYLLTYSNNSLAIIFGSKFSPASVALVIILLGQVAAILFGPGTEVVKSDGNTKYILLVYSLSVLINVLCNSVLIPRIGISGAAIGTSLALSVQAFLLLVKSASIIDVDFPYVNISKTILIGIVSSVLLNAIYPNIGSINQLFVTIITFSFVYMSLSIVAGILPIKQINVSKYI